MDPAPPTRDVARPAPHTEPSLPSALRPAPPTRDVLRADQCPPMHNLPIQRHLLPRLDQHVGPNRHLGRQRPARGRHVGAAVCMRRQASGTGERKRQAARLVERLVWRPSHTSWLHYPVQNASQPQSFFNACIYVPRSNHGTTRPVIHLPPPPPPAPPGLRLTRLAEVGIAS